VIKIQINDEKPRVFEGEKGNDNPTRGYELAREFLKERHAKEMAEVREQRAEQHRKEQEKVRAQSSAPPTDLKPSTVKAKARGKAN
jgi:hypothetical protein